MFQYTVVTKNKISYAIAGFSSSICGIAAHTLEVIDDFSIVLVFFRKFSEDEVFSPCVRFEIGIYFLLYEFFSQLSNLFRRFILFLTVVNYPFLLLIPLPWFGKLGFVSEGFL